MTSKPDSGKRVGVDARSHLLAQRKPFVEIERVDIAANPETAAIESPVALPSTSSPRSGVEPVAVNRRCSVSRPTRS